ncbi:MAG: peptidylprolyl isomerase [Rhodovibrio sp.]|nr:peptidylprolyl isomerase [Rhodovibrio sp.]
MRRFFSRLTGFLALIVLTIGAVQPAAAQQSLRAAAVVNDQVISQLDVEMRMRLVMLSAGISPQEANRARLRDQVMRNLINERLQLQAAERFGFSVSEEEIDQAVQRVARNNDMSADQFLSILRQNNVTVGTFREQLRANLAWQKVIQNRLARDVTISDEDIDDALARYRSRQGERQYRVREIFLAVDDEQDLPRVRQTAQRLMQQLRQGAEFGALARQFSQAPTAADNGVIGWVTPENLPEPVAERVTEMQPGQLAGPVRGYGGLHIVNLMDTRVLSRGNETVELRQLFKPVPEDADAEAVTEAKQRLQQLAEPAQGCGNFDTLADDTDAARTSDLGEVKMSALPDNIRPKVADLPLETPSEPLQVAGGYAVLMVCERSGGIDRQQIRQNLQQERLNMLAQRYMRDLRRQANIEIQMGDKRRNLQDAG